MNIRPIKTEADYDAALIVIEELMGAAPTRGKATNLRSSLPSWRPTKQSTGQ